MLIIPALAHADLLSDKISNLTDGTETASGGFQATQEVSDDARQFSVNADFSGAPEPSTEGLLAAAGFMTAGIFLLQRYRNRDGRG
jgi:hypothetical protein